MNREITLTWNCCLCGTEAELKTNAPPDWGNLDNIGIEDSLCPQHAVIEKFISKQCPGCTGGWTDCDLWRSFAYTKVTLTDIDFLIIEKGVCPKRTGGTFVIENGRIENLDLSNIASNKSSKCLATGIREYLTRYAEDQNHDHD